jgi:hypothetical protein
MENSEFAVSVKPTKDLMHGIECATSQTVLPKLYVRTGDPPSGQDLRLYDLGQFQFATQNNPVQNLGELWVSYCVEFFKPILPAIGLDVGYSLYTNSASGAAPFGTGFVAGFGDLQDFAWTSTTIRWTALPGVKYLVNYIATGGSVAITAPVGSNFNAITNGSPPSIFCPANGETATRFSLQTVLYSSLTVPGTIGYTLGVAGTIPTNSFMYLTIQTCSPASAP